MTPPRRPARRLLAPKQKKRGGTRAWDKMSKQVAKEEPRCWLRLPGCTIRSTGADHYHPVSTHPGLEFVRSNLRGACHHCNTARRDTPVHELPALRAKMELVAARKAKATPRALGFFK